MTIVCTPCKRAIADVERLGRTCRAARSWISPTVANVQDKAEPGLGLSKLQVLAAGVAGHHGQAGAIPNTTVVLATAVPAPSSLMEGQLE